MTLPPWENYRASITPADYEKEVAKILRALGNDLPGFSVKTQERISTPDGRFRIDVTARFSQLGGDFLVLVECKDHVRPVEREDVQVLADRMRVAHAHKGMLFSTNGFQKGAILYAKVNRIALVRFVEGGLTYVTKEYQPEGAPRPQPPPWADIAPYLGIVTTVTEDGRWSQAVLDAKHTTPLVEFLVGSI